MASTTELQDWMEENIGQHVIWYVKRLSGNDTMANGGHQAGPYLPREVALRLFPSINRPNDENPDARFELCIDSHRDSRQVRVVWYNNHVRGTGTRNEARLTNFGGSSSALLDPESTGSLAVFAFHCSEASDARKCNVWICDLELQAELVEERIGPVEPGQWRVWTLNDAQRSLLSEATQASRSSCWLEEHQIPPHWLIEFPTGAEIIRKTVELRGDHAANVDARLLKRRDCEFEIFRSLEQAVELPLIQKGFATIEDFVARANSILQRRKSRSGNSLELHVRELFLEERLLEGIDFQHKPEAETGRKPDFLFPSEQAYKDPSFPACRLRMLAAKTTCKDRWRQVLSEAARIEIKHLLTLQEGISEAQFKEMTDSKVQLVVPSSLFRCYPDSVQPHLQTLESFIGDVRLLMKQ